MSMRPLAILSLHAGTIPNSTSLSVWTSCQIGHNLIFATLMREAARNWG